MRGIEGRPCIEMVSGDRITKRSEAWLLLFTFKVVLIVAGIGLLVLIWL